jgi:hypothetical protein
MNCFLAQLKYPSDELVDETKLFYVLGVSKDAEK